MNPIIDDSVNLKSNDEYYQGIKRMTITMRRIDYSQTNSNGGYITYLRLLPQIPGLIKSLWLLHGAMSFSWFHKYVIRNALVSWVCISFLFQMMFKPLLCIFKVKRRYIGTFETGGAYGLRNQNVVKYVTFYLIGVPVLHFKANLKEKDWEYILSK